MKKKVARIDKQENSLVLDLKLSKKKLDLQAERDSFKNDLNIAYEADKLALKNEFFLSNKQDAVNKLELAKMEHE